MVKLSVIVPVYNTSAFLNRCLDSILNQSFKDFELLIINDGSKDDSQKIINDYVSKHSNITAIEVENCGQGRARNLMLDIAKGKYIAFIDSDDYIDLNMFKEMISFLEEQESDVVVCDCEQVGMNYYRYNDLTTVAHPLFTAGSPWNKIYRKDIIRDIRFPEDIWYEDFVFTALVAAKTTKYSYIHKPFNKIHVDNQSTMRNNNSKKNLDIITAFGIIEDQFGDRNHDELEYLAVIHILQNAINRVSLHDNLEKENVIKELRDFVTTKYPNYLNNKYLKGSPIQIRTAIKLNGSGRHNFSKFIFKVKNSMK